MAIYEPGRCNTGYCYPDYIKNDIKKYTFGNCTKDGYAGGQPFAVPNGTIIKTALNGAVVSPWVRLRFEGEYVPWSNTLKAPPGFWDYTEITTGNISQPGCAGPNNYRPKAGVSTTTIISSVPPCLGPVFDPACNTLNTPNPVIYEQCMEKCRAAIKLFQYSWGTIDSGNKCKVTIVDELGSSLSQWIGRLFRNPTNTPIQVINQPQGAPSRFTNTLPQGSFYKMKVTFGWLIVGGDDDNCPVDAATMYNNLVTCSPSSTTVDGWTTFTSPATAAATSKLICSPPLYFIPDQLNVLVTNGRYVYEIEGIDALNRAQDHTSQRTYGNQRNPMHFALAVKKMAAESFPPFQVDFLQRNPNPSSPTTIDYQPMLFTVVPGTTIFTRGGGQFPFGGATPLPPNPIDGGGTPLVQGGTAATDTICLPGSISVRDISTVPPTPPPCPPPPPCQTPPCPVPPCPIVPGPPIGNCFLGGLRAHERLGMLGVWPCNGRNPLQTIHNWLANVSCQGLPTNGTTPPARRGIIANFDPTFVGYDTITGSNGRPTPIRLTGRLILWADPHPNCANMSNNNTNVKAAYLVNGGSCSPVLSFNPTMRWNFQALATSGGNLTTETGRAGPTTDARQLLDCNLPGQGLSQQTVVSGNFGNQIPRLAQPQMTANMAAHRRANILTYAVEAELKVQGDPSNFACSPLFGTGQHLALIVTNPFYISNPLNSDGSEDTTDTSSGGCNAVWTTLTASSCNTILTSDRWFIKGVDHQIKEGSYVTTYKLFLPAPGNEVNPTKLVPQPIRPRSTAMTSIPNIEAPVSLGGYYDPLIVNPAQGVTQCAQGTSACMIDSTSPYEPTGEVDYAVGTVGTRKGTGTFCESFCDYVMGPI
jgi:hypothetical protein